MARAIILVLDSFGIGATADADSFGDAGSDTFGHIARERAAAGKPLTQRPGHDQAHAVVREQRVAQSDHQRAHGCSPQPAGSR